MDYTAYEFASKQSLITAINNKGWLINDDGELKRHNIITDPDTGKSMDLTYLGKVVKNYPDTGEGWEPELSDKVYCHTATPIGARIATTKQLKGAKKKYFNNYINRFAGETKIQ